MKHCERLSSDIEHLKTKKSRGLLYFTAILLIAAFLAIIIGCGIYVNNYYRADETALAALASSESVTVDIQDSRVVFIPSTAASDTGSDVSPAVGFIFYPGGKVEHTAYAPLLRELAENGVLCVLVEMPLRLAVLDMNAAEGIPEELAETFPNIERWYIGGHSLGGSMAASFVADAAGEATFSGLALLASYSTADLTSTDLQVLSLYGTKDQVLNLEKYEEYRGNLPADTYEVCIDGGNHAQFGNYGSQEGDEEATIPAKEQLKITVQHLLEFFQS